MSVAAATVVFFALLVGVFLVPLIPALREIRQRVDANALPIAADGRMAPTYFAERFRDILRRRLSGPMSEVRAQGLPLNGTIDGGEDFCVLPHGALAMDVAAGDRMVIAAGDLDLGKDRHFLREVYAEGDLTAGDDVVVRATLVDGDTTFGAAACSLRWLHGARDVTFGPRANLQGRVSSGARLRVDEDSIFERLHAPRIEFGEPRNSTHDTPTERRDLRREELPSARETSGRRTLVHTDVEIPAGTRWVGDLVVRGRLHCGRGAQVLGAVKADLVRLEENAEIEGSVVSTSHVFAREGVRIGGLILAEGHVDLSRACVIGTEPDSTSIRASSIDVSPGTVVLGTVWVDPDEGRVTT